MGTIYEYSAKTIDGQEKSLADYTGKVLLVVNTASRCGFTPQYRGLEELYQRYRQQGLEVLGFPCNQFGAQEPGSESEIAQFCDLNYQLSFPLFAKIDVNGKHAHPLYTYLRRQAPGVLGSQAIKWNFTKFLINREGKAVKRFAPATEPKALAIEIESIL